MKTLRRLLELKFDFGISFFLDEMQYATLYKIERDVQSDSQGEHGNITLRFGYTLDSAFKTWIQECVSEVRGEMPRNDVQIELIDINGGSPQQIATAITGTRVWLLTNAWVTKYTGPELDAKTSDVAIETVELAYEELVIPN